MGKYGPYDDDPAEPRPAARVAPSGGGGKYGPHAADDEPEDAAEHREQQHDQYPHGFAHAPMARRRLHSTVDDGEDPERGQHQRQNQQHSRHTPILGATRLSGPAVAEL